MRTPLALITLALLTALSSAHTPCPPLEFTLKEECVAHRGLASRLEFFRQKVEWAKRLHGIDAEVRVHVFASVVYSKFTRTTDDAFSETETDLRLRPTALNIYIRWSLIERASEVLLEHIALHEIAHFINGDIPGYRPNGALTEAAAEHRVLSAVGEVRYREYLREYYEVYRPRKIDYDAFVDTVRRAEPRSME